MHVSLHNQKTSASLFQQIQEHVTFAVRRILLTGAFFDRRLDFLRSLRQWCPAADIVVGIDPDTVLLPSLDEALKIRFVDARAAWPDEGDKYLHAKALYLEGDGTHSVFLSGSANPSAPGWGISANVMNTEAMLLLQDSAAKAAIETTGLNLFFDYAPIAPSELAKTVARAALVAKIETAPSLPILIGIVDYQAKTISMELPSTSLIIGAQPIDESGEDIAITPTIVVDKNLLRISVPEHLAAVRSVLLLGEAGAFARVLVHHSSVIDAHSASKRQQVIRAALGEIGTTEADVAWLIEQVQQVIFSAEAADHVGFQNSARISKSSSDADRPETLAAEDAEFALHKKKRRLIKSGDLGYLIDTLIRFLHIPRASVSHHVAEPVSLDDEGAQDHEEPPKPLTLDDPAIAEAIVRKSRALIKKMIERENQAASERDYVATMLVQLVAVLAILKELRHLERQGRWRNSALELVDSKALEALFQKSMYFLFSSSHRLWASVEADGGDQFEELDALNLLLTWLAWEVGHTFTPSFTSKWGVEKEDRDWRLAGNGYLARLLPRVSVESQWELLQISIQRTIRPIPKYKKESDEWLELNTASGYALLDEFTNATKNEGERLSVGGFAYVPRHMEQWSVVLDVYEGKVALWDFGFKAGGNLESRRFLQSAVIPARPITNPPR